MLNIVHIPQRNVLELAETGMELTRAGSVSSDPEVNRVYPKPGADSCIHTQAGLGIGNRRRAGEGPVGAAPSPKQGPWVGEGRGQGERRNNNKTMPIMFHVNVAVIR